MWSWGRISANGTNSVTVAFGELADREQSLQALLSALPDADQDPGRERDALSPRSLERLTPRVRRLEQRSLRARVHRKH